MINNNKTKDIEFDELNEPKHTSHVHGPGCNHGIKPIERTTPKIGRNDVCTCGSQKKFKKCCGK